MGRNKRQSQLHILMNGHWFGTLTRSPAGALEFEYTQDFLESENPIPISSSMPLREEPYRDLRVHTYFDNLLPDNEIIRRKIALSYGTKNNSPFELLAAIGRDCVGALQFIPENETSHFSHKVLGEPLTDKKIGEILSNLKTHPLGLNRDYEFRISLAGAQEKTALLYWKKKWSLPLGTTATTHILKPTIGSLSGGIDMNQSIENEWLCLKLVEHFGLPVAKANIVQFDKVFCLSVERFDRKWSKDQNHLYRIPQEDLCQAFGISSGLKYEPDGGPGIKQIMEFLNASDNRDQDRKQFIQTQLVFFLLGATDGHAKNFSITLKHTGYELTPIYDVLSIFPALDARQLEIKKVRFAMAIGNSRHYQIRQIFLRHWEQTAHACGFPIKVLHSIIEDLIEKEKSLDLLATQLCKKIPEKLVNSLILGIRRGLKTLQ